MATLEERIEEAKKNIKFLLERRQKSYIYLQTLTEEKKIKIKMKTIKIIIDSLENQYRILQVLKELYETRRRNTIELNRIR